MLTFPLAPEHGARLLLLAAMRAGTFNPDQARDEAGKWTGGVGSEGLRAPLAHNEWKDLPAEPEYLYHATNEENVDEIANSGLVTHAPSFGTDQDEWPDGKTERRSYFIDTPAKAYSFAPESGKPILLRVRRDSAIFKRESTGDYYTTKKISSDKLTGVTQDKTWVSINFRSAARHPESVIHRAAEFNPDQPRDEQGQWTSGGGAEYAGAISADEVGKVLASQHSYVVAREEEKEFGSLADTTRYEAPFLQDRFVVSDTFELMDIPIESVLPLAAVKEGNKSRSGGPIIVDSNKGSFGRKMYGAPPRIVILDGKHRYSEALARGDKTIKAYVGNKALQYISNVRSASRHPESVLHRAAEFNPDQPRDEQGQWTSGGTDRTKLEKDLVAKLGTTSSIDATGFVLKDGTRIPRGGIDHKIAAGGQEKFDALLDEGVVRYVRDGVEVRKELTDQQATLIADDWNYSKQDAHYIDVKGKTGQLGKVFYSSLGKVKSDTLRNFVAGVLSGKIRSATQYPESAIHRVAAFNPDQARDDAGKWTDGSLSITSEELNEIADSSLPKDTETYEYFYHAFDRPSTAGAVEADGVKPGRSNQVFLSKDEIRDRGQGFAIVRVPKGQAEEGVDVVEHGLKYREFTVQEIPKENIVRVVRFVPDVGGKGHGNREDEIAAYALTGAKLTKVERDKLPLKYQTWFKTLSNVTRHPESALHRAADRHVAKLAVAVRYAFARGREKVNKDLLRKAIAARDNLGEIVMPAANAVAVALRDVLPGTLREVLKAGGDVATVTLRTAEFNPDQPRDEQGQWTTGSFTREENGQKYVSITHIPTSATVASQIHDKRLVLDNIVVPEEHWNKGLGKALINRMREHAKREGKRLETSGHATEEGKYFFNSFVKRGEAVAVKRRLPALMRGLPTRSQTYYKFRSASRDELRTAKGPETTRTKFKFNARDPRAIDWADHHAAELVTRVSETTRQDINNTIVELLESGDWESAYDDLLAAVGDEARATLIARHETMSAVSEGQRQAWEQAVDEGLLTGDERRVWIVVGDEKVCPECEALDGTFADLDGEYANSVEGPPAHVACRCTEGIA